MRDHGEDMLKLRMDMPRTFELVMCETIGVHFRYKGKLYMMVRGIRPAPDYRRRIYKMARNPDDAEERLCHKCGARYLND